MKALDNDARMDVKWFLLWAGVGAVNRPVSPAGGDPEGPGVDTKGMSHPLVGGHERDEPPVGWGARSREFTRSARSAYVRRVKVGRSFVAQPEV